MDIKDVKKHPAYYYNYILLWLFTKGFYSMVFVKKHLWKIK